MKKRLLPITAVCLLGMLFGVTSCGPNEETSNTTPNTSVTEPEPSVVPSTPEITVNSLIIKNKENFKNPLFEGGKALEIELELDPVQNIPLLIKKGILKVTSDHPEIAEASGLQIVPKREGKATITISVGSKSDSVTVTVEKSEPLVEKKVTFDEMVKIIKGTKVEDNKTLYTVSGFATGVKGDKYGNFMLSGKVNNKVESIQVYGCSINDPFSYIFTADGDKIGVSFENKQDFLTVNPFHEGEYVTIRCIASAHNSKGQLLSQFVEKPAAPEEAKGQKVDIKNDNEKGTVNIVKNEGLTMGEEVSFTVEPKEGYHLKAVLLNGSNIKAKDGTYKFYTSFSNEVEVIYGKDGFVTSNLSAKSLGVTITKENNTEDVKDKVIDDVKWSGTKLGLYYKDKSSLCLNKEGYIENTTATAQPISEIAFNYADSHDNKNQLKIEFFNKYGGEAVDTQLLSTVSGTTRYVVKPAASATFVKISYNMDQYSAKFVSIEIETPEKAPFVENVEIKQEATEQSFKVIVTNKGESGKVLLNTNIRDNEDKTLTLANFKLNEQEVKPNEHVVDNKFLGYTLDLDLEKDQTYVLTADVKSTIVKKYSVKTTTDNCTSSTAYFDIKTPNAEVKPVEPTETKLVASYDLSNVSAEAHGKEYFSSENELLGVFKNSVKGAEISLKSVSQSKKGVTKALLDQGPKCGGIKIYGKPSDYEGEIKFALQDGQKVKKIVYTIAPWKTTEKFALSLNGADPVTYEGTQTSIEVEGEFNTFSIKASSTIKSRPTIKKIELFA